VVTTSPMSRTSTRGDCTGCSDPEPALSGIPMRQDRGVYVVVTGAPASGKSTMSRSLAPALGLPLLAKDTIKGALVDALGVADVEQLRVLGRAAVTALLAVAVEARSGVLDSVWVERRRAITRLGALPGHVVEVFCLCDPAVLRERFARRAASRGSDHFDLGRPATDLWNPSSLRPLDGGWPVIEIDTSISVDIDELAQAVTTAHARTDRS
jgi:predicted kinase